MHLDFHLVNLSRGQNGKTLEGGGGGDIQGYHGVHSGKQIPRLQNENADLKTPSFLITSLSYPSETAQYLSQNPPHL